MKRYHTVRQTEHVKEGIRIFIFKEDLLDQRNLFLNKVLVLGSLSLSVMVTQPVTKIHKSCLYLYLSLSSLTTLSLWSTQV